MVKQGIRISFLLYIVSLFTMADNTTLYVYSNLLFGVFAFFSGIMVLKKRRIELSREIVGVIIFVVFSALSCLWTTDVSDSIVRVVTLVQLLALLVLIYNDFCGDDWTDFFVTALWIGGICLCIVFFAHYSLSEIIESYAIQKRLGEEVSQVNAVSLYLAIFIVINVYMLLFKQKKICAVTGILGIVLLSTTQTRAALLSVGVGSLVVIWYKIKDYKKLKWILLGTGTVAVIVLAQTELIKSMFWRVYKFLIFLTDTSNSQIDYSAYVRLNWIKDGLGFFFNKPVLGYGIAGAYSLYDGKYTSYFHNNYVQLLVEGGIIGFVLYYLPIVVLLCCAIKRLQKEKKALVVALLVLLLVRDITNSTYYHKITYALLGICMCIVVGEVKKVQVKVAEYIGAFGTGGIEHLVMQLFKYMDHKKWSVDFVIDLKQSVRCEEEIYSNNGRVISIFETEGKRLTKGQKLLKLWRFFCLLSKEEYDIVHFHFSLPSSLIYCFIAKIAGVKAVVVHSHNNAPGNAGKIQGLFNKVNRYIFAGFATGRIAVSEEAGRWMYGKRKYEVLTNGIEVENFRFDEEKRRAFRKKCNIAEDTWVIGHVGRFCYQKNQSFLLQIFSEINKVVPNVVLMLIGVGETKEQLVKESVELGIEEKIVWVPFSTKVQNYYQMMDAFVFPSLYEGFGIVALEAQTIGLPVWVSDRVPEVVKVTENIYTCSLEEEATEWAKQIIDYLSDYDYKRIDNVDCVRQAGFSIEEKTEWLERFYEQCLKGERNNRDEFKKAIS